MPRTTHLAARSHMATHPAENGNIHCHILPLLPPMRHPVTTQIPINPGSAAETARAKFKKRQKRQCSPSQSTLPPSFASSPPPCPPRPSISSVTRLPSSLCNLRGSILSLLSPPCPSVSSAVV